MDLSGSRLELPDTTLPVTSGWLTAFRHDGARGEVRGYLNVRTTRALAATAGELRLLAHGITFTVVLLQAGRPREDGLNQWRLIATCDANLARPHFVPKIDLTATQEFFVSAELQVLMAEGDAVASAAPALGRHTAPAAPAEAYAARKKSRFGTLKLG